MNLVEKTTRKGRGEVICLQNNVGRMQEAHQTLLEIGFLKLADFIFVQEPAAWKNKENGKFFTLNHPSFYTITPKNLSIRPRVLVYIRKKLDISYKLRYDLVGDTESDMLIIEIKSGCLEKSYIINIYNEKALDSESRSQKQGETTIERGLLNLNLDLPFLLVGDLNLHHIWWNSEIENPTNKAQKLVDWLHQNRAELVNSEELATFYRSTLTRKSIIDLAFTARFRTSYTDKWKIAETTGSDHQNIAFSLFTSDSESFSNPLYNRPYNLTKANWEVFQKELGKNTSILENNLDRVETLQAAPSFLENSLELEENLEGLAISLTKTIKDVVNAAIPKK